MGNKRVLITTDRGCVYVVCDIRTMKPDIINAAKKHLGADIDNIKYILKLSDHLNKLDREKATEFIRSTKTINLKGEVI